MANRHDSISSITPAKETWSVAVRVVRLWFVSDFSKQKLPFSMEMVLMDGWQSEEEWGLMAFLKTIEATYRGKIVKWRMKKDGTYCGEVKERMEPTLFPVISSPLPLYICLSFFHRISVSASPFFCNRVFGVFFVSVGFILCLIHWVFVCFCTIEEVVDYHYMCSYWGLARNDSWLWWPTSIEFENLAALDSRYGFF